MNEPVSTATVLASFAEFVERVRGKGFPPPPHDCDRCNDAGWLVSGEVLPGTSMTYDYAYPCPDCKPDWVHPDERKVEEIETKDQQRARQGRATKEDHEGWWQD